MTTDNCEEAVRLADLGISVIRVAPGRKIPLEAWKPFTNRARTPLEARRDFRSPSNIAVVTGEVSGLVAVDCDSNRASRYALSTLPASQMMVRSPGGGVHIYYRCPQGTRIGCSVIKQNGFVIELKGEGGCLNCPKGSDQEGREYRWLNGPPTRDLLNSLPTFSPTWLPKKKELTPRRLVSHASARLEGNRLRARRYISHIVSEEGNGGHNSAYRATKVLQEFGLTAAEAFEELLIWNGTNAIPTKWTEKELQHKVTSVYRIGEHQDLRAKGRYS